MTIGLFLALALHSGIQGALVRVPGLPAAPSPGQVLAKVDGKAITTEDVAPLLWDARGTEVLLDVIAYQVIKAEADRQGVVVTDQQVAASLEKQIKELGSTLQPGQDPETELAAQGITRARAFLKVKSDQLLDGMAAIQFKPADWVKVSTILVAPAASGSEPDAIARAKVQKASDRLKAGETWAKVSEDTIENPAGKQNGGLVGWRSFEVFPAEFKSVLATLAAGGVTAVGKTSLGYQLFRVETQGKDAKGTELDELKSIALPQTKLRILRDLQTKAKIERLFKPDKG